MNQIVLKQRNSNIELLRIVTMIFIIAHHYVVNSGLTASNGPIYENLLSWRSLFLLCFGAFGKIGINCFVLITGYFMCTSQITVKKFFKLLFEIMFYKIVIGLIFLISGYTTFSWRYMIQMLIPITVVKQNFAGTYLLFFLSIPFLNILIQHLTEKQHLTAVALLSTIYILFGTLHRVDMNYVSWYIVLYFIASYIRLYPKKIFENQKICALAMVLCIILSCVSIVVCAFWGKYPYYFVVDSNTLLATLTGVFIFLFFKNLNLQYCPIINGIASTTFGVLMIHANSDSMRQWLWIDTLKNVDMYYSRWMPLHAIGSVLLIFIVCSALDYLRIRLIENPFFTFFNPFFEKTVEKIRIKFEKFKSNQH